MKLVFPLLFLSVGAIAPISILEANARDIPKAECKNGLLASNSSACGFNCKRSGDGRKVDCAEWPGGRCQATYTSVSCGPPAPENWVREYRRGNIDIDWRDDDDKDKRRRLRRRRRQLLEELDKLEEELKNN